MAIKNTATGLFLLMAIAAPGTVAIPVEEPLPHHGPLGGTFSGTFSNLTSSEIDGGCGGGANLTVTFDTFGCHHLGNFFNAFQAGEFTQSVDQNCMAFTRGAKCGTEIQHQEIFDFGNTGGHCASPSIDNFFDGIRVFGPCESGTGGK